MVLLLTILTALAVLILVLALMVFVAKIADTLLVIGSDPKSYLAKINFGVSAIKKETDVIGPQVTQLNQGLTALAAGLQVVDQHLAGTIEAVSRQEVRR